MVDLRQGILPAVRGSHRKKRAGYYELRVYLGRDPITGKDRYRSKGVHADSDREADAALNRFVAEVQAGEPEAATEGTLGFLLDRWVAHGEARGWAHRTSHGYRQLIRAMDNMKVGAKPFTRIPLDRLRPSDLDSVYDQLLARGLTANTVGHYHRCLRAALHQAVRWGWVSANIADRASPPPVRAKRVESPSTVDVGRILDAASAKDPDLGLALRLAAATGARRGEVCALRWSDLDGTQLTIRQAISQVGRDVRVQDTKTHGVRTISLDPGTVAALDARRLRADAHAAETGVELDSDGFILSDDPTGAAHWKPDRLTRAHRRICAELGVPARLHDLRHFVASFLLDQGESVMTVAGRLGHADPATTYRVYAHMLPAADERAAAAMGRALDG